MRKRIPVALSAKEFFGVSPAWFPAEEEARPSQFSRRSGRRCEVKFEIRPFGTVQIFLPPLPPKEVAAADKIVATAYPGAGINTDLNRFAQVAQLFEERTALVLLLSATDNPLATVRLALRRDVPPHFPMEAEGEEVPCLPSGQWAEGIRLASLRTGGMLPVLGGLWWASNHWGVENWVFHTGERVWLLLLKLGFPAHVLERGPAWGRPSVKGYIRLKEAAPVLQAVDPELFHFLSRFASVPPEKEWSHPLVARTRVLLSLVRVGWIRGLKAAVPLLLLPGFSRRTKRFCRNARLLQKLVVSPRGA